MVSFLNQVSFKFEQRIRITHFTLKCFVNGQHFLALQDMLDLGHDFVRGHGVRLLQRDHYGVIEDMVLQDDSQYVSILYAIARSLNDVFEKTVQLLR